MKIAVILGTRPEIIKLAPVITTLRQKRIEHLVIHTGQHYSYNLDKIFFKQLSLPKPDYKLEVGSAMPGKQTGLIISKSEKILKKTKPDIVLVQGDTNTVLGGAIAARKSKILVGHIEAGLRSYDESMPEEWNRILADHCSDFLFAPTKNAQNILINEGIPKRKIFVTGNTIVDSIKQNKDKSNPNEFPKTPEKYFLVSLHRQENVDNQKRFHNIVKGLKKLQKEYNIPVIFPIHPRSRKMAKKFKISLNGIDVIEPTDYLQFLHLQKNAMLVLTDSGGVQEESCILKVPCVTLRDNTERPETVNIGANMVAGQNPVNILSCTKKMLGRKRNWNNPFGDGKSAVRIITILQKSLESKKQ